MMAFSRLRPQDALLEQSRTVLGWLQSLPPEAFEHPTVLPDWNVRQLAGHLVLSTPAFGNPWISRLGNLLCRSRSM